MITASENYVYTIGQVTPFNSQCILKLSGELTTAAFLKALQLIQKEHPHLRMSLTKNPIALIECHQPIPHQIISKTSPDQWKEIAEQEINSFFNTSDMPLGRVILIQGTSSHEIIITLNHIICDGISICQLGKSFYHHCVAIQTGIPIKTANYPELSLEKLLPQLATDSVVTEDDFKTKNEKSLGLTENHFPKKSQTHFVTHRFSEEETSKIMKKPKEYGTTVHAMLSAAAITAMNQHLIHEKRNSCKIQYISPINLRPMLTNTVLPEELGHYVGCYLNVFHKDQYESFWKFANLIKSSLTQFIDNQEPIKYILSQDKLLSKYATPEQLVKHIRWKGPVVGVSNVGLFQTAEGTSSLQLETIHPVTCMPAVWDFPFAYMVVASTMQNRMQIDLMYVSPTISRTKAQRYLSLLVDTVQEYTIDSQENREVSHATRDFMEISRRRDRTTAIRI